MTSENKIRGVGPQLGGISFDKREMIMYMGVHVLLESLLEDYLDEGQIEAMAQMLRRLRKRPADIPFSEGMCQLISDRDSLTNLRIPCKRIGREELSTLIYNISPYALLNRRQAAILAKCAFPNYFASVGTIYTTFNKRQIMPRPSPFSRIRCVIPDFRDHTVEGVEKAMMEVALSAKV